MNELNSTPAWWTRRGFLTGSAAALAGAHGLSAHRGVAAVSEQFDGTSFQLKAPEPSPKYGGVLRVGLTNRPPHFDVHQSGTYNNLGAMACMFDNLVRRDPRDSGKTIIPDLAHSWEISKDSKTYTFFLRKGVQFSDGADFTADDVKATFDRIVRPPEGISIPRSILFKSVS
jgi:peptide/nickel transport system substrate-binding protein